MKTTLIAAASAATLALTLAGCGSDSGSDSSSGSGSASGGGTIAEQMIFGGPPEFKTRADGIPGLEENYGVTFGKYTVTDVGGPVTVNALLRGQVDAADLFTTDPAIEANDFVILEDPKSNFAAQNIVPIINSEKATDGVKEILNQISDDLDTETLGELIGKVANDKEKPEDVAKTWLADEDLDASGDSAEGVSLTVGSANFTENIILAEIYAQALEAQGADVQTKLNIGSREKYYPALEQGSLDLFPEYTGTILTYIDKSATATSPEDVYAALGKALPKNLEALDYSEAQDSDAVVVTKETAEKFDLETIADLAKNAG
ncbi:Substrate binding domain of ABC-type glycine betaine transport system [Nocardioides scoriae]|uniref:Substrate binding domain of ABC-type glycine betaine transport system n=1 Tax=Nocardioides scoriae TaxID=642780 RepID=A0A1H1TZ82_9ACTN|nr:glycine betaine ABC transporter substrate-binding protein [Nocardioides scoriae]SDS65540.1 Substrate binding domain of ABC-type glycine betaine transport system [Nocardioides scoriae]